MSFQHEAIETLLKEVLKQKNEKLKVSEESITILCDYLQLLVKEAFHRMHKVKATESADEYSMDIDLSHYEKILSQLLLDF
ncbi:hypothetical protein CYY_003502 [Polysphondylium violaceum]|uniref:Centromere protein X n=1 Tax=Polysphondylium violaceum TaxID=133409 RepID=A0A8J4V5V6_9MYCE|nr:hypothetical protein CYY_003502 [Polysphondylium violaceum]